MSVWTRIGDALKALAAGEGLTEVFGRLRTPPERTVGFAIAVIALSAKMAKADGQVTRDEVTAFREIFSIPAGEEQNAARIFNLARQDVAGFEAYAAQIARMFGDDRAILCDLMEGLFHIAMADGDYHPGENLFLERVAEIFGIEEARFRGLRARMVPGAAPDPYDALGVTRDMPLDEIRKVWRSAIKDAHPDRMIARGVPPEAIRLAEARVACLNTAWDAIRAEHAPSVA